MSTSFIGRQLRVSKWRARERCQEAKLMLRVPPEVAACTVIAKRAAVTQHARSRCSTTCSQRHQSQCHLSHLEAAQQCEVLKAKVVDGAKVKGEVRAAAQRPRLNLTFSHTWVVRAQWLWEAQPSSRSTTTHAAQLFSAMCGHCGKPRRRIMPCLEMRMAVCVRLNAAAPSLVIALPFCLSRSLTHTHSTAVHWSMWPTFLGLHFSALTMAIRWFLSSPPSAFVWSFFLGMATTTPPHPPTRPLTPPSCPNGRSLQE
jgi:hypothetical protein